LERWRGFKPHFPIETVSTSLKRPLFGFDTALPDMSYSAMNNKGGSMWLNRSQLVTTDDLTSTTL
jgi:hypothetical protein